MKKLFSLFVIAAAVITLTACGRRADLTVFIPNYYWSQDVIDTFNEEFGVTVEMRTFDSNEEALIAIHGGASFDIFVPSDYAIEELANTGRIIPIDWDRIELEDDFVWSTQLEGYLNTLKSGNNGFDLKQYAVPYFWGTVGIIYNNTIPGMSQRVATEGFGIIGASDLRTVVYNSPRCSMMAAMLRDPSNPQRVYEQTSATQFNLAGQWLGQVLSQPNTSLLSDQILSTMPFETPFDAVIAYSGDATWITYENSDYSFFNPDNTNVWIDAFTISSRAGTNVDLAYEFLSYMLTFEAAMGGTEAIFYTSMRQDVIDEFTEWLIEEGMERSLVAFENVAVTPQIFRFNDQVKTWLSDAWLNALVTS